MGKRARKAGVFERVGGLSVLAFMLIKKFPTSQYFTGKEGLLYFISEESKNWLIKGKWKREKLLLRQ